MIRRKHLAATAVALIFLAQARADQILNFGTDALPVCAYECRALYAAQFECGANVGCFCEGVRAEECGDVCGRDADKVRSWLDQKCVAETASTKTTKTAKATSTKATKLTGTSTTSSAAPSETSDEQEKEADAKNSTVERATSW